MDTQDNEIEKELNEVPALEPEKSMDDTIRETLNDIKDRGTEADALLEPDKPTRDDKGKFKAKVAEPKENAPNTQETTPEAPNEQTVGQELQKLGLRKDEAAEWSKTPAKIQEFVQRRTSEMMAGLDQYKTAANFGNNVYKEIQPYEANIRSLGLSPEKAVGEFFKNDYILRTGTPAQKQQAATNLLNYYGIDTGTLNSEQPYVDPQINNLQSQLQQMQAYIQQQSQNSEQAEMASLNSEIAKVAQGKEHFDAVRPQMAALLQSNPAMNLETAYEQAIWAHPDIRNSLIAKQQEDARKESAKKAAEAKTAASINFQARGRLPATSDTGGATMDETIRNTLRKLQGA